MFARVEHPASLPFEFVGRPVQSLHQLHKRRFPGVITRKATHMRVEYEQEKRVKKKGGKLFEIDPTAVDGKGGVFCRAVSSPSPCGEAGCARGGHQISSCTSELDDFLGGIITLTPRRARRTKKGVDAQEAPTHAAAPNAQCSDHKTATITSQVVPIGKTSAGRT